jgi:hypothetical protein
MSEVNVLTTTLTPTVRRLAGAPRGASARTGWEASPAPDPKQSVQSMQEANVQDSTPMPIVGRKLETGASAVPRGARSKAVRHDPLLHPSHASLAAYGCCWPAAACCRSGSGGTASSSARR